MTTESKPSSSKAKQTFLDLTSPSNRTAIGEQKVKNARLSHCYLHLQNGLSFDVADSQSLAALVDLCIELGQQHQGSKYKALNQWSWLLDAAREDIAALVQLIMERL